MSQFGMKWTRLQKSQNLYNISQLFNLAQCQLFLKSGRKQRSSKQGSHCGCGRICKTFVKKSIFLQNYIMAEGGKNPIHIHGNDRLSDRLQLFQEKAAKHEKSQKSNPFSTKFDSQASTSVGLSKDDPRYGRPPEGSKTEMRGKKAHSSISKEVLELCSLIREYGEDKPDGRTLISFGQLFDMYTVISNKLVGMLLRARKHGLLTFDGEMLYQRRDEGKVITLFPKVEEEDDE